VTARTLTNEELQIMNMFEQNTGARAEDVVIATDSVVFVVQKGDLGRAIGKHGANIERLHRVFGREVEVVENSDEIGEFVGNLFRPATIERLDNANGTVTIKVADKDKGLAIGRGGKRVNRARMLLKRLFDSELRVV